MKEENQLTTTQKAPLPMGARGVELESFEALWRFANCIAASPFAPKGMEKAEAIVPCIQLGLELGLSPMAALQNIAVINGRPGIYGDAALALVRASGRCESYTQRFDGDGESRKATVTSKRVGEEPLTSCFSVADAKKAGLWGKQGPWTQYPDRMLLFRARGFNLRDNFGDVLKGLSTMEELGDIEPKLVRGREIKVAAGPVMEPATTLEADAPAKKAVRSPAQPPDEPKTADAPPFEPDTQDVPAIEVTEQLMAKATNAVRNEGKATAAFIQKACRVGFQHACAILDALEAAGVVGPMQEGGRREVLAIQSEEL